MAKEIEKKYVMASLPEGLADGQRIEQGYLSTGDPEVRLRLKGDGFFLTSKQGSGLVREEIEFRIPEEVFRMLWPLTDYRRIEKTRYRLEGPDRLIWEIDEYHGLLAGLVIAEVELPEKFWRILVPEPLRGLLISDVTEDPRFKNKSLAETRRNPSV